MYASRFIQLGLLEKFEATKLYVHNCGTPVSPSTIVDLHFTYPLRRLCHLGSLPCSLRPYCSSGCCCCCCCVVSVLARLIRVSLAVALYVPRCVGSACFCSRYRRAFSACITYSVHTAMCNCVKETLI